MIRVQHIHLSVGDLSLALLSGGTGCTFQLDERYRAFITSRIPEFAYRVHCDTTPQLTIDCPVFETGVGWRLFQSGGKRVVATRGPRVDPHQLAVFEPDYTSGDIFVRGFDGDRAHSHRPLAHPLGILLTINLLAQGHGVLLHACGVDDGGRGYLFAGTGGSGKTTTARLWAKREGVRVLGDDRIILREREGRFWIYGTPWPGEGGMSIPDSVPLEHVFLVHHASTNETHRLNRAGAAAHVLANAFPTHWDSGGMAYTLGLLARLSATVPCSTLGFLPDASAVDYVRCLN